jgi:hypothetical protein
MKNSLLTLIVCWLGVGLSFAQTTIATNHTNNNGNGSVTFNVQNTNAYDIIITDINCHLGTSATNNLQLLYRTTPVNDLATPWSDGVVGDGQNGWISAGSGTVASNTANGVVPALTNLSLTIPAGATYALGFSATTLQYMTLTNGSGANVNTFTGGGVNLITGDGVSWGGTAYPSTPANYPRGFIGSITFIPAVPCTSPPTAGAIGASINPVCPNVNSTLSITGGTSGTGQTYQWQSSADGVTFADIAGATFSTYVANTAANTYYQAIITCGGLSDTTAPFQLTMQDFMNCYCTTSMASSTSDEEIYNVTINGSSTDPLYANAAGCATPAPGPGSILNRYSNFKTLAPITTVAPGQNVAFSIDENECDGATFYACGIAMWIDYNHNGLFTDAGEQVYIEAGTTAGPRTASGNFTVPITALPGNTVVRVVAAEGYSGASLTPCLAYGFGETEDYLINIECPDLAGPSFVDVGVCSGNTATLNATPSYPGATISWWDAATGGTQLANTTSYTTPTLMADMSYYVQEDFPSCPSSVRDTIDVIVTEVDVTLAPVDATCNGLNNGSFTQTSVQCGTGPFLYSIDNGVTFGPIPTDLVAGSYMVIVQDATLAQSVPYQVIVNEPTAPTALNVTDIGYFVATLEWTAEGDETDWTIEYGPAGFTPGTGTIINNATNPQQITGLNPQTEYEFYVAAGCSPTSDFAGPYEFATNTGFFTFDNACGPGFTDISGTGTPLNLTDDQTTVVTSSFPLSLQGVTSDQITISNNGWINWGGGDVYLNAWSLDLDSEEGNVYYETVNIGGTNYFIVQWDNRPRFPGVVGQSVTFQLLVNETTGEIYYIYEDVVFGGTQSGNDYGGQGTISVDAPEGVVTVSSGNTTYLTNNSCVHFYNSLCPNPVGITTQIFSEEAFLNWSAGPYGETEWTIIYGPAGFDPAAVPSQAIDTLEGLMTPDAIIGGLTQLTEYDAYLYSECALDNLTSGGLLINFTTLPNCSNPASITGTTDVDSLEIGWNWTETPGYPISGFNIMYGMTGFALYSNDATEVDADGIDFNDTIMDAALLGGGVYQVYVQAECSTGDTSSFSGPFTLIMPLSNDSVCGAEMLNADGTVYTFNNAGATVEIDESSIAPPADGAQVTTGWTNSTLNNTTWFMFVAPASGSVRVNNTAINYNGQAAVYSASNCGDFGGFTLEAANDNEIGGSSVAPNYTICGLTPGMTYYLMHDGFNGTTGNYSISVTPIVLEAGTAAPVTDVCTGDDVDLFTTVNGEGSGGVWSSSIASVNASIDGSTFETEGLAYQTFNIQYRITDGCAYDSILTQVHIFGPSNAGQDGVITACRNEPIDLLSGLNVNADLNGDWYDPMNVLIPSSSITTANIVGTYNYDYIAGNGVCPDDTANVVVTVQNCNWLDIQEEVFNGVSLYPNPSEGVVFITSDVTEAFDYVVTDAKGAAIAKASGAIKGAQTNQIDLSNAETGVYFIRLSNSQAEKVFRVVIQ